MRIVIFGPQGAGKGTQSALISDKYQIPAVSTGEIFRWAIKGKTSLGLKVLSFVDKGKLVPDELTIGVVRERLEAGDAVDGFLLDGFPRNVLQAERFDQMLSEWGTSLDGALVLEVPEDVSLRRLLGRRVCSQCGRNYHLDSPPAVDWTCDDCGGQVVERVDDHEEATIRGRLNLYHEQTEPLKNYYQEQGLLRQVGGEGTTEEVFARITRVL
ncbi:MAG: adenylate kinase [Actinobacteria bacterium]|nr:adenylate kinase [Actinomycetota bacterium]